MGSISCDLNTLKKAPDELTEAMQYLASARSILANDFHNSLVSSGYCDLIYNPSNHEEYVNDYNNIYNDIDDHYWSIDNLKESCLNVIELIENGDDTAAADALKRYAAELAESAAELGGDISETGAETGDSESAVEEDDDSVEKKAFKDTVIGKILRTITGVIMGIIDGVLMAILAFVEQLCIGAANAWNADTSSFIGWFDNVFDFFTELTLVCSTWDGSYWYSIRNQVESTTSNMDPNTVSEVTSADVTEYFEGVTGIAASEMMELFNDENDGLNDIIDLDSIKAGDTLDTETFEKIKSYIIGGLTDSTAAEKVAESDSLVLLSKDGKQQLYVKMTDSGGMWAELDDSVTMDDYVGCVSKGSLVLLGSIAFAASTGTTTGTTTLGGNTSGSSGSDYNYSGSGTGSDGTYGSSAVETETDQGEESSEDEEDDKKVDKNDEDSDEESEESTEESTEENSEETSEESSEEVTDEYTYSNFPEVTVTNIGPKSITIPDATIPVQEGGSSSGTQIVEPIDSGTNPVETEPIPVEDDPVYNWDSADPTIEAPDMDAITTEEQVKQVASKQMEIEAVETTGSATLADVTEIENMSASTNSTATNTYDPTTLDTSMLGMGGVAVSAGGITAYGASQRNEEEDEKEKTSEFADEVKKEKNEFDVI